MFHLTLLIIMDLNMLLLILQVKLSQISIIHWWFSTSIILRRNCKQWNQLKNSLIFLLLISLEKRLKIKLVSVKAWFSARRILRIKVGNNKIQKLIHLNLHQQIWFNWKHVYLKIQVIQLFPSNNSRSNKKLFTLILHQNWCNNIRFVWLLK